MIVKSPVSQRKVGMHKIWKSWRYLKKNETHNLKTVKKIGKSSQKKSTVAHSPKNRMVASLWLQFHQVASWHQRVVLQY